MSFKGNTILSGFEKLYLKIIKIGVPMMFRLFLFAMLAFVQVSHSATLTLKNDNNEALPQVMVTRTFLNLPPSDLSDDGYTPHGVTNISLPVLTRFTDKNGKVTFDDIEEPVKFRARAQGYVDAYFDKIEGPLTLVKMNSAEHVASYPSNVWLSQLDFGGDEALKKTFFINCSFCHQQASPFMRNERTTDQWLSVFKRMGTYGSRLPEDDYEKIAQILQTEYRRLRENTETLPLPRTWENHLAEIEMTEWPIGDGYSQMHDFILHPNGMIYIGDNLFDRIYEMNPKSGEYTVYKVPHAEDVPLGGLFGNRFKVFPKMHNYMGVHSFAVSKTDGNIFITPSMQQALLEFDIKTKKFITYDMPEGYYPHTIRTDQQDRVWFTMAVSSQVAMFDRTTKKFTLYDLPARSIKEWFIFKMLPLIFSFSPENRPQPSPDRDSTGLPMPYGIDVDSKGIVWASRLYANDIARIDPETDEITMIDFPFNGPRRLRVDANDDVWIVAFQDSLLVKYDPKKNEFTKFELPVVNELPYALNIDLKRDVVWVNGNQSDTILAFDIPTETWKTYPMPRQRFFTRDIEISEENGAVYTTNSHFPTWQSEGGTPTLLRITPLEK
jgi:virginiamycin B lyase